MRFTNKFNVYMIEYDCTQNLSYDINNTYTKTLLTSEVEDIKGETLVFKSQFKTVNETGCPVINVKFEITETEASQQS